MRKAILIVLLCVFLCGCSTRIKPQEQIINQQKDEQTNLVTENKINCMDLEKKTWNLYDVGKRIDYEQRKKEINYYYDACTRPNTDRWYSLGLEAIIAAEQAETEENKIKYLEYSYANFSKSLKSDGFMAASQAIATGKEYYKINQYEKALEWFEKAKPYYQKTKHTKLGALPVFIGDVYLALECPMTAIELYSEAYENLCTEINNLNYDHCAEISQKINQIND